MPPRIARLSPPSPLRNPPDQQDRHRRPPASAAHCSAWSARIGRPSGRSTHWSSASTCAGAAASVLRWRCAGCSRKRASRHRRQLHRRADLEVDISLFADKVAEVIETFIW